MKRWLSPRLVKAVGNQDQIGLIAACILSILLFLPEPACAVVQFQKVFVSEYLD